MKLWHHQTSYLLDYEPMCWIYLCVGFIVDPEISIIAYDQLFFNEIKQKIQNVSCIVRVSKYCFMKLSFQLYIPDNGIKYILLSGLQV